VNTVETNPISATSANYLRGYFFIVAQVNNGWCRNLLEIQSILRAYLEVATICDAPGRRVLSNCRARSTKQKSTSLRPAIS